MPNHFEFDDSLATQEAKPQLKRPSRYQVVMLNDDYTTMDFVVEVLMQFFAMPEDQAFLTMYKVHEQGQAVCGIYSKDVAETKATQVMEYAQLNDYPLRCNVEPAS